MHLALHHVFSIRRLPRWTTHKRKRFPCCHCFGGWTRMYPEKERVPVTWADACLTVSFFALQKILRFALFAAAGLRSFWG